MQKCYPSVRVVLGKQDVIRPTNKKEMIEMQGQQATAVDQWSQGQRRRREVLGEFDTGIRCKGHGRTATVIDHATDNSQPAPALPPDVFGVSHGYWCDQCGLPYRNEVIEGKLGYVPRERSDSGGIQ
jgi:hypothetical protein